MKFQTQNPATLVDHRAIRCELYRTLNVLRKANKDSASIHDLMKNMHQTIKRSKSQPSKTRKGQ